jgi:hypothetical protein
MPLAASRKDAEGLFLALKKIFFRTRVTKNRMIRSSSWTNIKVVAAWLQLPALATSMFVHLARCAGSLIADHRMLSAFIRRDNIRRSS